MPSQPQSSDYFSGKSEAYLRYRWDYEPRAIDTIFATCHLNKQASVADVGAGPGSLSRHFVHRVKCVYAIEPNEEMRAIADLTLGHNASFRSIAGLSHATTLPDRSVELIGVGRAIQWFAPRQTREEFLRICKPGGWLAILRVDLDPGPHPELASALKALREPEYGWNPTVSRDILLSRYQSAPEDHYFGTGSFDHFVFPATKHESWDQFFGRLTSHSGAPRGSHPKFSIFADKTREIFDRFSVDSLVSIHVCTELSLGRIAD